MEKQSPHSYPRLSLAPETPEVQTREVKRDIVAQLSMLLGSIKSSAVRTIIMEWDLIANTVGFTDEPIPWAELYEAASTNEQDHALLLAHSSYYESYATAVEVTPSPDVETELTEDPPSSPIAQVATCTGRAVRTRLGGSWGSKNFSGRTAGGQNR